MDFPPIKKYIFCCNRHQLRMSHSEGDTSRAEMILKELFTISLVAGDRRGIHERLARILPAGAYTLCNLLRGTETEKPMRAGPAGYHRRAAPRGRPSQPRRTPYGATTRPAPLIPLAYLPPEEQDALQQLELKKAGNSMPVPQPAKPRATLSRRNAA